MAKPVTRPALSFSSRLSFDASYLALAVISIVLGCIILFTHHYTLASDGSNYFSYLRSAFFDRDLDFHNEFAHFNQSFWMTYKPKTTVTGHLTNVFSVGPAVLWSPFYLTAHLAVLTANYFGAHWQADGFSAPYILAINLGSLFYGFAGMCLVYRMCKKYYGHALSLAATATVWLATFMLYYTLWEPYMSHATSFFAVTLFIYYWDATRYTGQTAAVRLPRQWAALGLAAGLMMLVRWQNGLIMILPAMESLVLYYCLIRKNSWPAAVSLLAGNILFLLLALAAFFPQMAAWKIIYGSFLTIPQGTSFLRWNSPFMSELLFSSRHGLYSWSPVVYISTIGWPALFKRDRFLGVCGLTVFLLMTYVNSVVSDWWAGWGFGMRRYDGLVILFALGLAAFLNTFRRWSWKSAGIAALCVFVSFTAYNLWLMDKYLDRKLHPGGPVAFNRLLGLSDTGLYKYTGYPFSFPANFLFSLKYGVSPARYDTVAGAYIDDPYFYGDTIWLTENRNSPPTATAQIGAGSVQALGDGWSEPLDYLGTRGRSIAGDARVYAPVRTVADFALELRCANPQSLPADLTLLLNGRQLATFKPQAGWQSFKFKLAKDDLKPGINILDFRLSSSKAGVIVEYLKFERLEYIPDWK